MLETYGEKYEKIEDNYEKDYPPSSVVMEAATLIEGLLHHIFNNLFSTLKSIEERRKFLCVEKEIKDKIPDMKKIMLGQAIGIYRNLCGKISDHPWLDKELSGELDSLNRVRIKAAHPEKGMVEDNDASATLKAARKFLEKTGTWNLEIKNIGFPLDYYLEYRSFKDDFKRFSSKEICRKIILDAGKMAPKMLTLILEHKYSDMSVDEKEQILDIISEKLRGQERILSLAEYHDLFKRAKLFKKLENGARLDKELTDLPDHDNMQYKKLYASSFIHILDILFSNQTAPDTEKYLEFANMARELFLEDQQITRENRFKLAGAARQSDIPEKIALRILNQTITTITGKEAETVQDAHEKSDFFIPGHENETGFTRTDSFHDRKIEKSDFFSGSISNGEIVPDKDVAAEPALDGKADRKQDTTILRGLIRRIFVTAGSLMFISCFIFFIYYFMSEFQIYKKGYEFIFGHKTETKSAEESVKVWNETVTGMKFVHVPGGCYEMGCNTETEKDCSSFETPLHKVCIDGFWIGKYEVTQGQWEKIMGDNPSAFKNCGENCPVDMVSWDDTQKYIEKLNKKAGGNFRVPTEAEWEYACRSRGKAEKYAGGDDSNVHHLAWYSPNSQGSTHPVGIKRANKSGIHDMSGNVGEWCRDRYNEDAYNRHRMNNPEISAGTNRVVRGGSWNYPLTDICCTFRSDRPSDRRTRNTGFRLVRMP